MDSDEEEPDERSILGENESILDTMSNWLPKRMLHWHYRSRHESLIAFSNEHFYDSKLIIFQSPTISSDDLGLRFTYIPDGEFDKGINRHEAEKVVDAIIDHARRYPNESLAVVTMNAGQQTLIEELLETRLVNRPSEKELMDKLYNMADPFIIKNLENIQVHLSMPILYHTDLRSVYYIPSLSILLLPESMHLPNRMYLIHYPVITRYHKDL